MKNILISLVFILLMISESQAATITSVVGSPSAVSHYANTPVSITWSLVGSAGFYTSSEGRFTNPATGSDISADDIGTTLNIQCVTGTMSIFCGPKAETIFIPASVIAGAQALGVTTINYSRQFSGGIPATGIVKITLLNTNLSINRESLRFGDNSTHKTIQTKTRISAVAELKYTGNGLLDAFWEYTSPLSPSGKPIFTPLSPVRRYLSMGGRVILQSPPLPTNITGQYVVRLRILKTTTNPNGVEFTRNLPDGLPVLRYSVIASDDDKNSLPPIQTDTPYDNTVLQNITRFKWQAVGGANAYQLEFYLASSSATADSIQNKLLIDKTTIENKEPSAGLLIPATETSMSLSMLVRDMLKQQQIYYWRIIAIGDDGKILNTSPVKTIRTP